jgi:hypothetical protein
MQCRLFKYTDAVHETKDLRCGLSEPLLFLYQSSRHYISDNSSFHLCKYFKLYSKICQFRRKSKVKVQFTLEQTTKAQKGSRGTTILFL